MSATQHPKYAPFAVDVEQQREVVCVRPRGELDLATTDLLHDHIRELVSAGNARVLLDLRQITFIDSTGLRLVLELERRSSADGWELGVVDGPAEVARIFDLTGMRPAVPFVEGSSDPRRSLAWH